MKKNLKKTIAGLTAALSLASVVSGAYVYADISPVLENLAIVSAADDFVYGDFTCRNIEGGIAVIKYSGNGGSVSIPSEINGKEVIKINDSAFEKNKSITSVDIPETVSLIGEHAFLNCENLSSVKLHEGLEKLLYHCFCGTAIEEVYIPASLNFANESFAKCSSLNKVIWGEGITEIPNNLFNGCTGLTEIDIPETVVKIGEYAFLNCENLSDLKLNEGLKNIGYHAFYNTGITSLTIPSTVSALTDSFINCHQLKEVTILAELKKIDEKCMSGNDHLESINVPSSVNQFCANAFEGCIRLNKVVYDGKDYKWEGSFNDCYSLKDQRFNYCDLTDTEAKADYDKAVIGSTVNFTVKYKVLDKYLINSDNYVMEITAEDGTEVIPESIKFNGKAVDEYKSLESVPVYKPEGTFTFSVKTSKFKKADSVTADVFVRLKATPHKDCAAETQLDFSSDCTEILQAYCRMAKNFCAR